MTREPLIRKYIKSVLLEMSREDVKSSKDPLDWVEAAFQDPQDWGTDDPFRAMIRAAKEAGLEELGVGTSRFTFDLGGEKVLKIARNKKGIEQNKLELTAGRDPSVHDVLASVYDWSQDYAWITSEKVDPLDDLDFKAAEGATGIAWADVRNILGLSDKSEYEATVAQVTKKLNKGGAKAASGGSGCSTGREFLESLMNFLERYGDMLPGDIVKLSSWGVNKKGCLVLLDYGITRKKFEELYK